MINTRTFYERVVGMIRSIPAGKVATYGQIARLAGDPRAARQVAYILHGCSEKEALPWHRVVNSKGGISLPRGRGYDLQRQLLKDEGIELDGEGRIDLTRHLFRPDK